jgi:RNA polymerase sigma-70 factor (ECF subfamily)
MEAVSERDFLDQHAGPVFNLALRLTGNRADAEDLAQDVLLKAVRALPGFRGESKLSTWTYRITLNAWRSLLRARRRRAFWHAATLGLVEGGPEVPAPEPAPDSGLESAERAAAVRGALGSLDDDGRAIVVLRELEDRSYEEIGTILGLPPGTVRSRLFRARARLRTLLEAAR